MLKKMKMEKKKLKYKFLVVCLMFILSFGLVSFNTFAFSTNAQVGDEITSITFTNFDYSGDDVILARFSNGYVLGYASGKGIYVLNDKEAFYSSPFIYEFATGYESYNFENPVEITYLASIDDVNNSSIIFEILEEEESTLLESIFDVFTNIGSYIMFLISSLIVVFYVEGQLTILGILALCGLAISIILLIINIIQNFLHFRG